MTRADLLRALYTKLDGDAGLQAALGGPGRILGSLAWERVAPPYIVVGVGPEEGELARGGDRLSVELTVVAPDVFGALAIVDALDAALDTADTSVAASYEGHAGIEPAEGYVMLRVSVEVWEG